MSVDIKILANIVFGGRALAVRTIDVQPRNGDPSRTSFLAPWLYKELLPRSQRYTEEGYGQVRDFAVILAQAVVRDGWHGEQPSLEEVSCRIASLAKTTKLVDEERENELSEYLLTQLQWLRGCGLL